MINCEKCGREINSGTFFVKGQVVCSNCHYEHIQGQIAPCPYPKPYDVYQELMDRLDEVAKPLQQIHSLGKPLL